MDLTREERGQRPRGYSELAKHRANRGESGGLSFDRDRDDAEADAIIERSDRLTLVGAPGKQTASPSL